MLLLGQVVCFWNEVKDLLAMLVLHVLIVVPQPVLPVQGGGGGHGVDLHIWWEAGELYLVPLFTHHNVVPHWPVGPAQVLG